MKWWPTRQHLSEVILVVGCFFLNLPVGMGWYYGNLSTYTNSYFIFHHRPGSYDLDPIWAVAVLISAFSAGMSVTDRLERMINVQVLHLANLIIFNISMFLTCYSMQHSIILMIVSFSLVGGFTTGVMQMQTLKFAVKAVPGRTGFVSAIVSSAPGFGAIAFNYAITAHTNEGNITPDVLIGNIIYFSQTKVLDNVPSVFFVIGAISFGFQVVGYLLEQFSRILLCTITITKDELSSKIKEETPVMVSDSKDYNTCHSSDELSKGKNYREPDKEVSTCDHEQIPNLKPSEVIRTKPFYILCTFVTANAYGIFVTMNYYKTFGQLWIKDDSFMANIGTSQAIGTGVGRLITGILFDVIGVKNTILVVLTINCLGMNLWYFAPNVDRWLYCICCLFLVGFQSTNYTVCPIAALKLFGSKHYGTNSGILLIPNVVVTVFILPFLISYLRESHGWLTVALVSSSASAMAIIIVIIFMPAKAGEKNPKNSGKT